MNAREKRFVDLVWNYYKEQGRHDLPWRRKSHFKPYPILVSEVMLQQTQVARVVLKYQEFLRRWGSARALASAPLGEVLGVWQGLGYNRRAKYLKEAAAAVSYAHGGRWPRTFDALQTLPGVGSYTAAAVLNFAYNIPTPMIETNIRTVYLHHIFADQRGVHDRELLAAVARTMDKTNPREWFWALMDYGAALKQTNTGAQKRSAHYKRQTTFQGSDRQLRGAIIRLLLSAAPQKDTALAAALPGFTKARLKTQLAALCREGLVRKEHGGYRLAT